MRSLFNQDLQIDWKIAAITVVSTLVIMLNYYTAIVPTLFGAVAPIWMWKDWDHLIFFLLVPLGVIFLFRESPRAYGLQIGDWRAGLGLTALGVVLAAPVLWFFGRGDPSINAYYSLQASPWLPLRTFVNLFGWEFLFRGWLVFAYARKFGGNALWLQMVPFAIAHMGKPELEALSTVFTGFAFGWIAWRTRSFLYPFLIHWFIMTFAILVASGALG